jgi:hypothetical protein
MTLAALSVLGAALTWAPSPALALPSASMNASSSPPTKTADRPRSKRKPVHCTRRATSEGGFPALPPDEQTASGLTVPGSLVIAGGSLATNSSVFQKMLELAGGVDEARIVFFPTNGGGSYSTPEQREASRSSFISTANWGDDRMTHPVVLMHTYDPEEADTEAFWAPLTTATGVFFAGGLPYRAFDAYFGAAAGHPRHKSGHRPMPPH